MASKLPNIGGKKTSALSSWERIKVERVAVSDSHPIGLERPGAFQPH